MRGDLGLFGCSVSLESWYGEGGLIWVVRVLRGVGVGRLVVWGRYVASVSCLESESEALYLLLVVSLLSIDVTK